MKRSKQKQQETKVYEKEVSLKEAKEALLNHRGLASDQKFNFDAKTRSYCVGIILKDLKGKEVDCFFYKVNY